VIDPNEFPGGGRLIAKGAMKIDGISMETMTQGEIPAPIQIAAAAGMLNNVMVNEGPENAAYIIFSLLGRAAGTLPDEFWNEAIAGAAKSCDEAGCHCEIQRMALMALLTRIRTVYRRDYLKKQDPAT
jgi:hypothetical protein